jgi:hypothetical protein
MAVGQPRIDSLGIMIGRSSQRMSTPVRKAA